MNKEEILQRHIEIVTELNRVISIEELEWLNFVVDDDSTRGHWVASNKNGVGNIFGCKQDEIVKTSEHISFEEFIAIKSHVLKG